MRALVRNFFLNNPAARDEVIKAVFAYHYVHFSEHPAAHNFTNGSRYCACRWCGRTRELVRWDDLPPTCSNRPKSQPIEQTIFDEEARSFALIKEAGPKVQKAVRRFGSLNAECVKFLWETHGIDKEIAVTCIA